MNMLRYLYQQSWRLVLFATITGAISGLASAGLVAVINKGISADAEIASLGWTFVALCAALLIFKICSEVSLLHLTQNAIYDLRLQLSRKLLATPLKRLQELGKHRLLVILADDINTFTNAFEWVPVLFMNSIVVTACLGYLAWLSWELLLMLALFLAVGIIGFHFAERRPLEHLGKVRELKDALYLHFRSLIEGSKELQLNRDKGEAFVGQVIAPSAHEFRQWFTRGMTGYSIVASVGTMIFYVNIGILLFLIPLWFKQPVEVLTGFTITLLYLIRPIVDLMIALPALRQASIALRKIGQLDEELTSAAELPQGPDPFPQTSDLRLEFRGVCHRYPGEREDSHFMLGPIDLTIEQGELIFLVGGNGSGKTTLAMLLLGFYAPEAGELVLNGMPVTQHNRDHYRQHFSAVFADFHLFEQLLGGDQADLATGAERYIEALGMRHKVKVQDNKFSTVALSTGQRKRLALVSAYLEDRPVYLFDEWAADQDPAFKRVFYTELLPELKARGKTVIAITHDDAYFGYADRILKLEDGHVTVDSVQRPDDTANVA
ncbi:cyclic peptide export ABC transporter [Allohahella sp. A8]|uniref:cyclic peptide export ABC transporter n=1 Tax=Allohahella sp. A8 TaxID=3141461 RepID=UPI003A812B29